MRFAAKAARVPQNASRATPFVGFYSTTFLRLLETYGFLYRNRKNVAYSRNVIRHLSSVIGGVMKIKNIIKRLFYRINPAYRIAVDIRKRLEVLENEVKLIITPIKKNINEIIVGKDNYITYENA